MKAWLLKDFGLDNLVLGEAPTPQPKEGELLVKVGAVSLNFRDKAIVDGIYDPHRVPKPLIPVSDAAGTVVAVGNGVTRFKVGDRVNSHLYAGWIDGDAGEDEGAHSVGSPHPGGLAEYMILNEQGAVRAPDSMSDEEASTLPIAALTAWYSLVDFGGIKPGQSVLVQGTGGVSIFAIQIASALGAKVIATSSRDENLEIVKKLGATVGINYRKTPAWEQEALKATGGRGVDLVLDIAGGEGVNQSVAAAKVGGRVAVIGFLSGQKSHLELMPPIFRRTLIGGIAVAPRASFERMNPFLNENKIRPVIDHVYAFEDARKAYEHLARGPFGKVVIKVG